MLGSIKWCSHVHDHQPLNHGHVLAQFSHLPASLIRTTISTKVKKKKKRHYHQKTINNIPALTTNKNVLGIMLC